MFGNCSYIFNYDNNSEKIDFNVSPYSDILANDLVANVVKEGKVGTYRHLRLPTDYDKCLSNEYFLNCGQIKDISGLQWYDLKNMPKIKHDFDDNHENHIKTKVEIYYAGVTFRDVLIASGIF